MSGPRRLSACRFVVKRNTWRELALIIVGGLPDPYYHYHCRRLTQSLLETWTPLEAYKLTSSTHRQVNWVSVKRWKYIQIFLAQTTCGRKWWSPSRKGNGKMYKWQQTTRLAHLNSYHIFHSLFSAQTLNFKGNKLKELSYRAKTTQLQSLQATLIF